MKKNSFSCITAACGIFQFFTFQLATAQERTTVIGGDCGTIQFNFNAGHQGFNVNPYAGTISSEMYYNSNRGYWTEIGSAGTEAITPPINPFGSARIVSIISPPVLNPNAPGFMNVGFDYIVPNAPTDYFQVRLISTYLPPGSDAEQVNMEASTGILRFQDWSTPIPYTDPNTFASGHRGTVCIALVDADITNPANTSYRVEITFYIPEASYSSIDNISFGFDPAIILRVNFQNIEAHEVNDDVEVNWNVTDEKDVLHYKIERSSNGRDFIEIGEVAAAGRPGKYSFLDREPLDGLAYYRVRNMDRDNKSSYSRSVFIRLNKTGLTNVYPVPATGEVTIEHAAVSHSAEMNVFTMDGKLLRTFTIPTGSRKTIFDLSAFSSGTYMLLFDKGGGEIQTLKLVKK